MELEEKIFFGFASWGDIRVQLDLKDLITILLKISGFIDCLWKWTSIIDWWRVFTMIQFKL